MKQSHLSNYEVERYVMGDSAPGMRDHLKVCPECRDAVATLEQPIALFRSAAIGWSAEQEGRRFKAAAVVSETRGFPVTAFAWGFAILLLLCAIVPVSLWRSKPAVTPNDLANDEALLRRVDEQVSASVPAPLKDLTALVASDSSSQTQATSPALKGQQ